jgi:pseudaminic acid synthase
MVNAVRQAESAIGMDVYDLTEKQKAGKVFARSLYVSKDIKKGEIINESSIRSVRPGLSLHPKYFHELMGKKALKDFRLGDRINREDFE